MAEKAVLRVPSAQHARCFMPSSLVENPSICERRFPSLLEVLYITVKIKSQVLVLKMPRKNSLISYVLW